MCNWKALFVTNMKLNYLVASKILLQGVLFAFFFKYFGLVSWRRYKEQRIVLTSSDERVDMLPAPAITLCPVNHQDQTGYKNLTKEDDDQPAIFWKGKLISHICEGKEGEDIVTCIEQKVINQTTIVRSITKGFQKEESLPENFFWRTEFSHGMNGFCSTIHLNYSLGLDLVQEAIWVHLNKSYAFVVFIHDPNFFLINNNPSLPMNAFLQKEGMIGYKGYVAKRHNINIPGKEECNSDPEYIFTACIKESFSRKVGCKQKWDSWTTLELPPCQYMEQYR